MYTTPFLFTVYNLLSTLINMQAHTVHLEFWGSENRADLQPRELGFVLSQCLISPHGEGRYSGLGKFALYRRITFLIRPGATLMLYLRNAVFSL